MCVFREEMFKKEQKIQWIEKNLKTLCAIHIIWKKVVAGLKTNKKTQNDKIELCNILSSVIVDVFLYLFFEYIEWSRSRKDQIVEFPYVELVLSDGVFRFFSQFGDSELSDLISQRLSWPRDVSIDLCLDVGSGRGRMRQ